MSAIGIFDSGVGGLSVFQAIRKRLPNESLIYLGDSARVPYGTKSAKSVRQYALQASRKLAERDIKALVIACNTASAVALPALQEAYPNIPVIGVIAPGAKAAVAASKSQHIAVIATESTVNGKAYESAIHAYNPSTKVQSLATQMLVAMAEEGWTQNTLAHLAVEEYLGTLFSDTSAPDTLMLGCTHFPVFRNTIEKVLGNNVKVVDSAETTADALHQLLTDKQLLAKEKPAVDQYLVTDGPERFARIANMFLGAPIPLSQVELVDL
ncbi:MULTISPECIES: glutamate racemase [Gammaproteobacteria]|uniref:glutamate racemase n=1 Tax=Gammaproteobacteria TaxID=1236 RepID=UPI000DCFBB60|nr:MULTISPECIES: glutamate racemase [Gammaproteobacteria]RTE85534.1 glutamate racemase [Aliidiomarina sp. B3213]TCZ89503.1 glutamate racemase [Lysobacter sp. N42]